MVEPHRGVRRNDRARPTRRGLLASLTLALVGAILVAGAAPASAFPTKLSTNGQMDFVFGSAVNTAGGSGGTVYKPESKLFYTGDGTSEPVRWWAVLGTSGPSPAAGVWLFELVSHQWVARLQLPGADPWAKADALFEGGTLYVSTRDDLATSGANIRQSSLYKISYNGAGTWGAAQGPFAITTGSLETLTLARDSANRLWVTYESGGQIRVGYTAPGGTSFTFITVSQTNVLADDVSAITAFGGNRIGVFWSDQNAKKDLFAWRLDSAPVTASWTVETAYGGGVGGCPTASSDTCGDDHMNVKVYQDQIYVSIKSGLNDALTPDPGDPLNLLLRRSSSGTWSAFPVSTVSQNVTRPITLLSPEQDKIWVWGTRGSEVDVWESSFSAPSFNSTDFIPWTKGASRSPADATSTKQLTTAATGAVVMSSTSSAAEYWHNEFLPVVPPPPNQLPTFDQDLPNRTDAEGAAITLPSPATDPDGDTLTYAATGLPNGLSINTATGTISGTIGYAANAGSPFSVSITVSDDGGTTAGDTDAFTWTVTNTNRLPTFNQDLPNRTDAEGAAITLPSPATDPDADTLTYAATGLPTGLSINASTGTISGTIVNSAQSGSPFSTSITVSDNGGSTVGATDTFTWTVTAAPAQITFRSASSAANSVAKSLVIPKPTTVANGDVMVAVIDVRQDPTATGPVGWSQVSMTPNGSTLRQYVFTKVATGAEPASYTFTFNQSRAASGAILAYGGVSTSSPVETFTAGIGSGTGITAPSATTLSNGAMVVGAFSINNSSAIAPPAGMTERAEVASGSKIKTEVADVVQAAAGATGAKTATAGTGTANVGQLIVLKPGSGGGGGSPNQDPTFDQNLANRSDGEGASISLSAHATDPENDTLTYAATGLPTGLSINTGTGLITGTISAGASVNSPFSTSVTVSDDNFATVGATDTFTWTVTAGGGGGGSITFRSASFGANNVGNNVVISTPAGVQAGDVMVAVIDAKAAPTITTPAGWTLLSTTPNGSNFKQAVYSRVATGSEAASTTWTINENRAVSGGIVAYSGVNTSNPVEILGTAGIGSTTSITAPSVTSAFNGAMVIGAFGINADSTIAPPAGMTERGEIVSATRLRTEICDVVLPSAGATGAKTATAATAAANIGQLILLRPA